MTIETRPLSPHLGMEILGVDLHKDMNPETEQAIRDAWIQAGVLLFRGGTSEEAHMRVSRVFGTLEPSALAGINDDSNPYMMVLREAPDRPSAATENIYDFDGEIRVGHIPWHWDQSFTPKIVRGAVLRMVELPEKGGETGFIDAIAAYERLPQRLKDRIEGLEVVYRFTGVNPELSWFVAANTKIVRLDRSEQSVAREDGFAPTVHPLVITQAETGRKALKISPLQSLYILGMEDAKGGALLRELTEHLTDETYAYFHHWAKDDLIVWDNWRMIHTACGVPRGTRRTVQRTTIMGDYGVGRYLDPALHRDEKKMVYLD